MHFNGICIAFFTIIYAHRDSDDAFSTGCQNFQTRFQLYFKNNEGNWECSEGWSSRIGRAAPGFWSWLHLIDAAMWLVVVYNERTTKKILNPESWPSMRTMPGSQKTYRGPSSTTALVITCDLRTPKKYMPDCRLPYSGLSSPGLSYSTYPWQFSYNEPLFYLAYSEVEAQEMVSVFFHRKTCFQNPPSS